MKQNIYFFALDYYLEKINCNTWQKFNLDWSSLEWMKKEDDVNGHLGRMILTLFVNKIGASYSENKQRQESGAVSPVLTLF